MTRKHFIALAVALAQARRDAIHADYLVIDQLASDIASVCARANPNFDRARFLEACRK